MQYLLACVFGSPVREYHRELVEDVARRFDLRVTQRQPIPAHFTLKYRFTPPDGDEVERVLETFAAAHPSAPLHVGGFGHFERDVVFVDVHLTEASRRIFADLVSALKALPWMSWDGHDAEHLHPHVTVVEKCGARFGEVWGFVKTREQRFTAELDNVTIFREEGERDGIPHAWAHRSFRLP